MIAERPQQEGVGVLLVDNEPFVRSMLAEVLRRAGFEVRTASSGLEAVELVQQCPPALVVMDVHMPGLSGWDALARLGEEFPDLLVVMMSGSECREEARERGAAGFLAKPYRPRDVLDYVREVLTSRLNAEAA